MALDRRSLLALGAASATLPLAGTTRAAQNEGTLPRLQVTPDNVIRQAAGLRPFRPSGFVVKAESLGEKIIVHNYGHGGCGVTLCWGTADMAAKLALETPHRDAAVIGCGVIGLTSAGLLQDRGFKVTIYASDLPPNTTSDVAAGAFGLTEIVSPDHQTDEIGRRLAEAVRFAHRYFEAIGARYGVRPMTTYMLGAQPIDAPWEFALTPELFKFDVLGPGEHPFPSAYASRFETLMAETNTLMPALLADFRAKGGMIETRRFDDRSELQSLGQPVIVNCTGIGAKALFGDPDLTPLKGQIMQTKPQPSVTYGYVDPVLDLYMFPRSNGLVLGGSHRFEDWSTEIDPLRSAQIIEGHSIISGGMR